MTGGHTPESLHERLTAYVQHRREAVRQAQHISDVVRASELSDFSTSELDTGIRAQTYMLDELEQLLAGEDVEVVRAGPPTQEQEKERG